ncbi:MAG TPA: hypothetical protein PLB10_03965 [Thiolinea sp.]|nr:hypothetical protein [Thiolinea sp.]
MTGRKKINNKPEKLTRVQNKLLDEVIKLVESFLHLDEWCSDFHINDEERELLVQELLHKYGGTLPDSMDDLGQFRQMALLGARIIRHSMRYRQLKEKHYKQKTAEHLQLHGIPLSQFPQLSHTIDKKQLTPADCSAFRDWPDYRRHANGYSGRLENAGQFMHRLLKSGLYDESTYGKLYLHDLRSINPKLYLALAQYQNRTDDRILENKQDEIDKLSRQETSGQDNNFQEKARITNARWRRRRTTNSS